ncbi:MAG: PD40 domain-containing protein, partial [Cyclobacteriaceae bacterium]|nr:PD40 domain-containing protein [Cyclobacteriaceae bacterium]
MKFIKTVVLTLLVSSIGFAQEIQWASELVFQYNNFNDDMYSGKQILGPPNARMGQLDKNAFRINKHNGYGVVTVAYKNPHPVSQIIIVENNVPGRLAKLVLYDTLNNEHILYEPNAKIVNIPGRVLNLKIAKTTFVVSKISVHLNTINYPGWAQIDAIGISEEIVDDKKISAITGNEELIFEEQIKFAGRKEKMTGSINTSYAEAKPLLSPDGKTLYFVRQNAPENTGGVSDDQDIYFSEFINNRWTLAQNIGEPLNDVYPNGICSISADGNTIWVINAYNSDGTVEDGISVSTKSEAGWSKPKKLDIIGFSNSNQFQDYFVSNSTEVILMAIEREDSSGDQDLYVSFKLDFDIWSLPLNLGMTINTPDVEYAPFLAADNRTLYFSSNGHGGDPLPSDVYFCSRLDDSWLKWTRPKPVGPEINSNGWDGYFTLSTNNDYAYFVSTEGFTTSVSVKDIN